MLIVSPLTLAANHKIKVFDGATPSSHSFNKVSLIVQKINDLFCSRMRSILAEIQG